MEQSYENLEILIIDDCSPDSAVRHYLEKMRDPRVRWVINETNLGTTRNYDTGVRLLSNDVQWCVILDNDDFLDRDFVKEAVQTHLRYPQAKVLHGRQFFVSTDKKTMSQDEGFPLQETAEDYLCLRCIGHCDLRSSCVFFDVGQFKKIGGYPSFPSGLGTDMVFIFSLAFDNVLVFAKDARVYIRIHEEAESSTADRLCEKLLSIQETRDYCLGVYRDNPGSSQRRKKKVMEYVRYNEKMTNLHFLLKRYREIVRRESPRCAQKSIREILEFCRKNKVAMPARFLSLAYFFVYSGVNTENVGIYNFLLRCLGRLDAIERSARYFLIQPRPRG
jgi:glycosyltransferase involved in cell wall biosynthesis